MAKINRVIDLAFLQDPNQIEAVQYNPASGAKKTLTVGPRLLPIPVVTAGTPGWTTSANTAPVAIPYLGANLAIYNNAGTAGSVTTGGINMTSQAIGAVDAYGDVGIACPPNTWTYVSMGNNQYVATSAATLIVYIIEDPTWIAQETPTRVAQFVPGYDQQINS
ncbi:MAG TPA: hypothetical protein VIJ14_08305 [Rhabdochlamydiaceae bacterium]